MKKLGKSKPEEDDSEESRKKRAELELLVANGKSGSQAEFKGNVKDKRFNAITKDKEFAIDPTHK